MNCADITFVVLTRNEAANIEACLASTPAQSPKLVYDAESGDETVSLARAAGAAVQLAPWEGYVQARTAAATLVQTPWTFMLDADERLSGGLTAELLALQPAQDVAAFSVPRRNWFCGKWIRGCGWWPDRLVRLFRTGRACPQAHAAASSAALHERWQVLGECEQLESPLDHFSYPSIESYRRKFQIYTALEAEARTPSLAALAHAWLTMPLRILWLLFIKGGLFDGWRGLFIATASAMYPVAAAGKAYAARWLPATSARSEERAR